MEPNQVDMTTESEKNLKKAHPTGFSVVWREIIRDKLALISFIFLVLVASFVYGISLLLDQSEIVKVDLFAIFEPPSSEFWLGTDYGGRDVFGQLIIGAKNSLSIGILVTLMSGFIGIVLVLSLVTSVEWWTMC